MVAVVILGAGFGTRLAKDLAAAAASGEPPMAPGVEWSTLQTLPKPLLPVWAGRPLLDEWLDALLVRILSVSSWRVGARLTATTHWP